MSQGVWNRVFCCIHFFNSDFGIVISYGPDSLMSTAIHHMVVLTCDHNLDRMSTTSQEILR